MSNTTELAEVNHKNIKSIAEELGIHRSKLHSGASRKEKAEGAKRAALFGLAKSDDVDDDRSDKAVREDLRQQNARNVRRIAKAVGVSPSKLSGEATSTEVEERKADRLGLPSDGSDEKGDRTKAELLGVAEEGE